MIDRDRIVEVAPHYAAMLLVMFLVLGIVRAIVGEIGFWTELLILVVIATAYPYLVRRLGVAPSSWENR